MPTGYDYQTHIVSARLRISGSGAFQTTLQGLEDSPTQDLADITMTTNPPRPVNLLSNIMSTKVRLYGRTTEIDEYFRIKNITFYGKQIASGYPQ